MNIINQIDELIGFVENKTVVCFRFNPQVTIEVADSFINYHQKYYLNNPLLTVMLEECVYLKPLHKKGRLPVSFGVYMLEDWLNNYRRKYQIDEIIKTL